MINGRKKVNHIFVVTTTRAYLCTIIVQRGERLMQYNVKSVPGEKQLPGLQKYVRSVHRTRSLRGRRYSVYTYT